jgi:hypothetical protein
MKNRTYITPLAALTEVNETPRTHTGAHNRFYVHFVETGRIDSQFTQTLRRAFNLRHGVDYNFDSVFAPVFPGAPARWTRPGLTAIEVRGFLQTRPHLNRPFRQQPSEKTIAP